MSKVDMLTRYKVDNALIVHFDNGSTLELPAELNDSRIGLINAILLHVEDDKGAD